MNTEPPHTRLLFLGLALLPAVAAAGYAIVGSTAASLSAGRKSAMRDTLEGSDRAVLDRYLTRQERIETRWLLGRVGGVTATAALLSSLLHGHGDSSWIFAWLAAVTAYAVPAELGGQFARTRAEKYLPWVLRLARMGEWLLAPFADPLYFLGRTVSGNPAPREPSATLTETEVELLVNEGELNGSLAHDQSEMIRNVLDFGEVTAEELMVPRIQVDALNALLSMAELRAEVSRTQHSRYPVYSGSIDNIIGILHVKDLFHMVAQGVQDRTATDIARKPVAFVAEGQLATTVLREMRAGRHHMAVILDEFGGVAGILTLEDLLEEIVGDIQDEHDRDDVARIKMLDAHRALVDASTPISDVNRALGTDFPEGDYVSLGGFLLEQLGSVPPPGSTHEILGFQMTIREGDERRIASVELAEVPGSSRTLSSTPPPAQPIS